MSVPQPRTAEPDGPIEPGDPELIEAVRSGDVEAYGLLYRRHVSAATTLARQLTGSRAEADDLVAEAFARVLDMLCGGGGPDEAFRAYLLTTLRNVRYDRARRDKKLAWSDDMSRHDPGVPWEDSAVADLETSLAARAFHRLPERWQTVLWHTEVEQESPADVAPLLGLTPNGAAALAYRAREGLRQAYLQEHLVDRDGRRHAATVDRLGAWARGGLTARQRAKVEAHLATCADCRALAGELADVNAGLRGVIAPLVLGTAAAGAYLAAHAAPAEAAAVAAHGVATAGGAAAGGAAAGGAAAGGAAAGGAAGGSAVAAGGAAAGGVGGAGGGGSALGSVTAWVAGSHAGQAAAAAVAAVLIGGTAAVVGSQDGGPGPAGTPAIAATTVAGLPGPNEAGPAGSGPRPPAPSARAPPPAAAPPAAPEQRPEQHPDRGPDPERHTDARRPTVSHRVRPGGRHRHPVRRLSPRPGHAPGRRHRHHRRLDPQRGRRRLPRPGRHAPPAHRHHRPRRLRQRQLDLHAPARSPPARSTTLPAATRPPCTSGSTSPARRCRAVRRPEPSALTAPPAPRSPPGRSWCSPSSRQEDAGQTGTHWDTLETGRRTARRTAETQDARTRRGPGR